MELDAHQDKVLIAMDGSLPSQIAATLACQIATFQHLKVKGLFVINEHYILDRYADFQPELGLFELPSSREVGWIAQHVSSLRFLLELGRDFPTLVLILLIRAA